MDFLIDGSVILGEHSWEIQSRLKYKTWFGAKCFLPFEIFFIFSFNLNAVWFFLISRWHLKDLETRFSKQVYFLKYLVLKIAKFSCKGTKFVGHSVNRNCADSFLLIQWEWGGNKIALRYTLLYPNIFYQYISSTLKTTFRFVSTCHYLNNDHCVEIRHK